MADPGIDLLVDGYGRVREIVHDVLDGLDEETLAARVDPEANSIGWLVWHLTRIQDDHVSEAAGEPQAWEEGDFEKSFGLPYGADATGYGHSSRQVGQFSGVTADQLAEYHDAVHRRTARYLDTVRAADLARVVDDSWQPPVTLGVRLVSVLSDDLQHVGQASYVRGLLERA